LGAAAAAPAARGGRLRLSDGSDGSDRSDVADVSDVSDESDGEPAAWPEMGNFAQIAKLGKVRFACAGTAKSTQKALRTIWTYPGTSEGSFVAPAPKKWQ